MDYTCFQSNQLLIHFIHSIFNYVFLGHRDDTALFDLTIIGRVLHITRRMVPLVGSIVLVFWATVVLLVRLRLLVVDVFFGARRREASWISRIRRLGRLFRFTRPVTCLLRHCSESAVLWKKAALLDDTPYLVTTFTKKRAPPQAVREAFGNNTVKPGQILVVDFIFWHH